MRTLMTVVVLLGVLAMAAVAADPTGKWKSEMPGRDGAPAREQIFTLKAEGEKLTGSISSPMGEAAISEGKINGDEISFAVVRERNGNTFKMLYKGKVEGNELKLVMEMEGRDFKREITAKKM